MLIREKIHRVIKDQQQQKIVMTGNLKISYAFKDRLGMAYEALHICLPNMDDKNTFD